MNDIPLGPRRVLGRSTRDVDPQVLLRVALFCDPHIGFNPTPFASADAEEDEVAGG